MPTYTVNTRAQRPDTGDLLGVWGDSANETIFDVFDKSFGLSTLSMADANTTFTIPDGNIVDPSDPRAMALDITSSVPLTQDRTITLAPNTVAKVWMIKNSTTGGFNIVISQGSGGNVTIAPGFSAIVATDGAGGTAEVINVIDSLEVTNIGGEIVDANQPNIDHATLNGGTPYPDIHVDHTTLDIVTAALSGLAGGQNIATNVTLVLDLPNLSTLVMDADGDEFAFGDIGGGQTGKVSWLDMKDIIDWSARVIQSTGSGIQITPQVVTPTGVDLRFNGNLLNNEPNGALVESLIVLSDGGNSREVAVGVVPLSLFNNDLPSDFPTLVGSTGISVGGQGIGGEGASKEFDGVVIGAAVGDWVIVNVPTNYARDLVYRGYVDAVNSVKLIIMNPEDSGSNITGGNYKLMVLRV